MNNQINLEIILGGFFNFYDLIKWIFIFFDLILFLGFTFVLYKSWKFRPKIIRKKTAKDIINLQKQHYRAIWFEIISKFELNNQESRKSALIDANNLIDLILKDLKIKGETLNDRLSKIHPESLESLKDLWEAVNFVDDIINNPAIDLNEDESKKILGYYEKFLKEIGVIIE